MHIAGQLERLSALQRGPVVAIVGTRRATDYGVEIARRMARDLSVCGLVVVASFAEGIAAAALNGGLEGGRALTAAVTLGGLDVCSPAHERRLFGELLASGCAVSEMPLGARPRRWCYPARNRMLAGLADLVVVVEAEDRPCDLMCAELARVLGRQVGAMPGRVTSEASKGTHKLLADGASIVRDASDVLDLLCRPGADLRAPAPGNTDVGRAPANALSTGPRHSPPAAEPNLPGTGSGPRLATAARGLRKLIKCLAAGEDTLEHLTAKGHGREEALVGLAELELRGLVVRGDGGRYVPCAGAIEALETAHV